MAKEAGAVRVYFVSCSPEVTHPHVVSSLIYIGLCLARSNTSILR